jgi:hypothetical protein
MASIWAVALPVTTSTSLTGDLPCSREWTPTTKAIFYRRNGLPQTMSNMNADFFGRFSPIWLLDVLGREWERREAHFVCYADHCKNSISGSQLRVSAPRDW